MRTDEQTFWTADRFTLSYNMKNASLIYIFCIRKYKYAFSSHDIRCYGKKAACFVGTQPLDMCTLETKHTEVCVLL
jgi:hypothetical protein